MKIVLAGATGFLGTALVRKLASRGESITVLSRRAAGRPGQFPKEVRFAVWDGKSQGAWGATLSGADAVINLSGESIAGGRWTQDRKRRILESRVHPTRALVDAFRALAEPPATLVNVSAIGYYGGTGSGQVTESDAPGAGFLADTCRQWEAEALAATGIGVRVVLPRIGVVLGPAGGVLGRMVPPFRLYAGGPIGTGRQWISWVHIDDVCGAIEYALDHRELSGPVNIVAPVPVTMDMFSRELGKALRRPSWLRVPGWALRVALGEMSELVLEGRQVVPRRLLDSHYPFAYQDLTVALRSLVS
jgi:uncharacterized protein (TIGR01777 family)